VKVEMISDPSMSSTASSADIRSCSKLTTSSHLQTTRRSKCRDLRPFASSVARMLRGRGGLTAVFLLYVCLHLLAAAVIEWQRASGIIMTLLVCGCGVALHGAYRRHELLLRSRLYRSSALTLRLLGWVWTMPVGVSVILLLAGLARRPEGGSAVLGMMASVGACAAMSRDVRKVKWKTVVIGLSLQVIFAFINLRTEAGKSFFASLGRGVEEFLSFSYVGSDFVFSQQLSTQAFIGFRVLPAIVFFSSFSCILFYLGWLQVVVHVLGGFMQKMMGTSHLESVCAASNIFLGQTEAPLLIAPYLPCAKDSELHSIMTSGFSTLAGGVLAAYISIGISSVHLISASVMSAPAALAFSKIAYPSDVNEEKTAVEEVEDALGKTSDSDLEGIGKDNGRSLEEKDVEIGANTIEEDEEPFMRSSEEEKCQPQEQDNLLSAAATGVMRGVHVAAVVGGMLIAFLGLEAAMDSFISWWFSLIGIENVDLKKLFGILFWLPSWLIGIPARDCQQVGSLLAIKTVLNEFVAYTQLLDMQEKGKIDERSAMIATYALCGFSNFGSVGIQLAGIGALVPKRIDSLSRMVMSALFCGFVASCSTACVAAIMA